MTTTLSYYPGCSLEGTARTYDLTTRAVLGAVGVQLEELDNWVCCGASSAHRADPRLAAELQALNLRIAGERGKNVVVPCAACYNRLKTAEADAAHTGVVTVLSLLEVFASGEISSAIRRRRRDDLRGLPVVAYYGCLLTRPLEVTGAAGAFDPTAMDAVLFGLGADVRRWSHKTICCGASFALPEPEIVTTLCGELRDAAVEAGARVIVTACPMCQSNLDTRQPGEPRLPVVFLTELMALAMELEVADRCWRDHWIDPRPLLKEYGLVKT
jgi:heterodisulfide reductase subunit B